MRNTNAITKAALYWVQRSEEIRYGLHTTIRLIPVEKITPEYALRLAARKECDDEDRKIARLVAEGHAVYRTGSWPRDTIEIRWQHYGENDYCDPHFEDLGRSLSQIRAACDWLQRAGEKHALNSPDAFRAWVGKQGLDLSEIPGTGYYGETDLVSSLAA